MDPIIKAEWVAALRSGDYLQGVGNLHIPANFGVNTPEHWCCLGVLCDIYTQTLPAEIAAEFRVLHHTDYEPDTYRYGTQGAYLPDEVARWADCTIDPRIGDINATTRNDDGESFETIAALIEEYL